MGFINLGMLNIQKRNSCASALVSLSDVQPPSVYKSHILNGPFNKLYILLYHINDTPFELLVFWPSVTESCIKVTYFESVSVSLKMRLGLNMMTLPKHVLRNVKCSRVITLKMEFLLRKGYSRTSMAQTLMARLPRLFRTRS